MNEPDSLADWLDSPEMSLVRELRGLARERREGLAWAEVSELPERVPDDEEIRLAAATEMSWPAYYKDARHTIVLGRDPGAGTYVAYDVGPGRAWITAVGHRVRLQPGDEAVVPELPWAPDTVVVEDEAGLHVLERDA